MEWYIPITILPGVGFFILSTSNLLIDLNSEIRELNNEKNKFEHIILAKISQLKKLNLVLILQYLSALLFVVGGVVGEVFNSSNATIYAVLLGIINLTISILLLIYYSYNSLKIRQEHLKI